MGLISFLKEKGASLFGDDEAAPAAPSNEEVVAKLELKVRQYGFDVTDLKITFADGKAVVEGKALPEVADKMVVALGNVQGVGEVDDRIERLEPSPRIAHYTVKKGDTLSGIAKGYYSCALMYKPIFNANRPMLEHPDKIYPGQVLIIPLEPAPLVHEVCKGDTLGDLAKRYYGEARQYVEIFEVNRDQLSSPDVIKVGQMLKIPAIFRD